MIKQLDAIVDELACEEDRVKIGTLLSRILQFVQDRFLLGLAKCTYYEHIRKDLAEYLSPRKHLAETPHE